MIKSIIEENKKEFKTETENNKNQNKLTIDILHQRFSDTASLIRLLLRD